MGSPVDADGWLQAAQELAPQLCRWRRHLHSQPELSGQEEQTSAYIAAELAAMGIAARRSPGWAVTADLDLGDGPLVALRADIDALPIHEETGLPFASARPGIMHACGHDGHTAILLGAARLLLGRLRGGRVRLIFQPAEEVPPGGAGPLIAAGVLDGVAAIAGLHLWCPLPSGTAVVTSGPAWAAADRFRVVLTGHSGHGAKPHEAAAALEAACRTVSALQSIVSRSVAPLDPAVVTVGTLHAGEAFNIVAGRAVLEGTVRAFDERVRQLVKSRIAQVVTHTAAAAGARAEIEYVDGYPPLHNDPTVAELVRAAAGDILGVAAVAAGPQEMAADDFARYLEHVPGCYLSLGAAAPGGPDYPNHHSRFCIDEAVLPSGAAILAATAQRLLGQCADGRVAPGTERRP